jgi:hypothetical protein
MIRSSILLFLHVLIRSIALKILNITSLETRKIFATFGFDDILHISGKVMGLAKNFVHITLGHELGRLWFCFV